jgi:hypothetical protein
VEGNERNPVMHFNRVILLAVLALLPTAVLAQESYKIEVLKEGPPSALPGAIKEALAPQGYRVLDDLGKTYAEFWVRKATPAKGKPSGPEGAVLFPVLAEGELLGALRFPGEGHDYRDQVIAQGVYTIRYGSQPVNGDHLGVSTYRDYALLVPAAKDKTLENLPRTRLEEQSAEAAGTNHPAVLMMLAAPGEGSKSEPTMVHNEELNTWGAVVPLSLAVQGGSSPVTLPVQLILIGVAAV